jgi:hypothetical protein
MTEDYTGVDELLDIDVLDINGDDTTVACVIDQLKPADKLALIDHINPTEVREQLVEEILETSYFKIDEAADPKNYTSNKIWLSELDDEELIKKHIEYV